MDLVVPDKTKSIQQNAIEPWSKPHYRTQLAELKRLAKRQVRLDVPWADLTRRGARVRHRRGWRGLGRGQGLFPLARAQEVQSPRSRLPQPVSRLPDLSGLPRRAPAPRGARRTRRRPHHRHRLRPDRPRGGDIFRDAGALGKGNRHCRQGAAGNPQAARVPARCRAGLPDARSPVVDALGRGVAAHQSRHLAGLSAGRHALRARRAVGGTALARQRSAHRDPRASCATRATRSWSSSTTPT